MGETLTQADESQAWDDIRQNQQRILESKKLKHRNFGTYSKHLCGYDTCKLNGLMIRQGSGLTYPLAYCGKSMPFDTDKSQCAPWEKSETQKRNRNSERQITAQRILEK